MFKQQCRSRVKIIGGAHHERQSHEVLGSPGECSSGKFLLGGPGPPRPLPTLRHWTRLSSINCALQFLFFLRKILPFIWKKSFSPRINSILCLNKNFHIVTRLIGESCIILRQCMIFLFSLSFSLFWALTLLSARWEKLAYILLEKWPQVIFHYDEISC